MCVKQCGLERFLNRKAERSIETFFKALFQIHFLHTSQMNQCSRNDFTDIMNICTYTQKNLQEVKSKSFDFRENSYTKAQE